ncbi:response regulator transcription factor [Haloactinopolyspora sp.]|uniref:response regulator transcription factor n=1 Tax=Haloactinopolyspora sp. TaxID=1966353 RepID=UPI00342B1DCB
MTPVPRVLLIEDDDSVRSGLELALRRQGHDVVTASTGEQGLQRLDDHVEIIVLDLMLPGIDGFEVCRRVRARGSVPIIMLTARNDDIDVVSGLEAGADDYVVKPVLPRVLDARIGAVLRRGERRAGTVDSFGDLVIDRSALSVTKGGSQLGLTPTELRLVLELSGSPSQVFSREQLLRAVWGHDYLGDSRIVDACVQRLRAKVEDTPSEPVYIQTVRGFGYRFGPV